jgi:hypothetical protein
MWYSVASGFSRTVATLNAEPAEAQESVESARSATSGSIRDARNDCARTS